MSQCDTNCDTAEFGCTKTAFVLKWFCHVSVIAAANVAYT